MFEDFKPSPAFQCYPDTWLASAYITLMTPAEEGAYARLRMYDWINDGIPDDDDQLAILSRLGEAWFNGSSTNVQRLFKKHPRKPGFLTDPLLERERERQVEWRKKCQKAGQASAANRRKSLAANQSQNQLTFNGSSTNVQPAGCQLVDPHVEHKVNSPSPSPYIEPQPNTWPSEVEVVEWGKMDGIEEPVCRKFYAHNQALGWMTGNTPVRNARWWLKKFAMSEYRRTPAKANGTPRATTVFEQKTRLEALEKLLRDHPGSPQSDYSEVPSAEERKDFQVMFEEAKKLRRELALGGPSK